MAKREKKRLYVKRLRFYADFRDYADVGGKLEALIPKDGKQATDDRDTASALMVARLADLTERRKRKALGIAEPEPEEIKRVGLGAYATQHLKKKAQATGKDAVTERWLQQAQGHLEEAVAFFGAHRDLRTIEPEHLDDWVDHLRQQDNGRGGKLSDPSVRKRLNTLSNLFRRARSEGKVAANPVQDMFQKPTEETEEAEYLTAAEMALLLESARTFKPRVDDGAYPYAYALLSTFMLTGGRKSEVFGLEVDDVALRLGKVYVRPNQWRRLKNRGSKRTVPLWPQLREILEGYLLERERTGGLGRLLFPSGRGGEGERMISDVRKALDRIAVRAGFPEGHVRLHMLRHSYCAARLQTCDRGQPIPEYTVARELGHSGTDMIHDRYGHLHDRTEAGAPEVVEYRVEHHREALKDRLESLAKMED